MDGLFQNNPYKQRAILIVEQTAACIHKVDLVRSGQSERESIDHRFRYPTGREAYCSVEAGRVMIRPAYEVRMVIVRDQVVGQDFRAKAAFC